MPQETGAVINLVMHVQRSKKNQYSEGFKELVMGILQQMGFEDRRSAKMTLDDFLLLLAKFNEKGVHFSS